MGHLLGALANAVDQAPSPAREVSFHVVGLPATKGSAKAFVRGNRAIITNDNPRGKPWQAEVKAAALEQMGTQAAMAGPVSIVMVFYMPRPQGHFRTGKHRGVLRDSAPALPITKPDVDKMVRPIKDALSKGVVYGDDAQVVDVVAGKRYAERSSPLSGRIGVVVKVRAI